MHQPEKRYGPALALAIFAGKSAISKLFAGNGPGNP
jgi:hypothetical protein